MKASRKLILRNVRGSYVRVMEGNRKFDEDDPDTWGMTVIMPKEHPQMKALVSAAKDVATEAFGSKVKLGTLKMVPRDGDREKEDPEYEGCAFFNVRTYRRPGLLLPNGATPTDKEIESHFYSGAMYNLSIVLKDFDHPKGGKGVRAELRNVMFAEHGERLDGGGSAASDFEDLVDAEADPDDIPF